MDDCVSYESVAVLCDVFIPTLRGRGRGTRTTKIPRNNTDTDKRVEQAAEVKGTRKEQGVVEVSSTGYLLGWRDVVCWHWMRSLSQPSGAGGRGTRLLHRTKYFTS